MTMMHRLRYLAYTLLWAIVLALLPSESRAGNAVIFTDATVAPGDVFTINVIIENDIPLGGLFIPFRWSTDDLIFVGLEFEESRLSGTMETIRGVSNPVDRTASFLITPSFTPGDTGSVPVGSAPIAYLTFRVAAGALDQAAFCDSALEQRNGTITRQVQFTDLSGTLTILPDVVPGLITIGDPTPGELIAAPAELFLRGQTDGDDAIAGLSLYSDNGSPLDWSLAWRSSWLTASPSIGKTPAVPTISATLFQLAVGTYHDTITVQSDNAVNTIVTILVVLVVDSAPFVDTTLIVPDDVPFVLMQNRPNPFVTYHDTRTEINYVLEEPAHVTIEIYNSLGQRVRRLISRSDSAGAHAISWDGRDPNGRDVPSGHYFYRMSTNRGSITKRMIVIK